MKKIIKKKMADGGSTLNRDNYNSLHTFAYQNDPQYGQDSRNHGQFAAPILDAFNKTYPDKAINPNDIQRYQQDMIGNPQAISGNLGFSQVDNKYGPQSEMQRYMNYQVQHMDAKGNMVSNNYYGTNQQGASQEVASWNKPIQTPQWQSNDQGIPMASNTQASNYVSPNPGKQSQQSNWHTNESTDYSIDSVREVGRGGKINWLKNYGEGGKTQTQEQHAQVTQDQYNQFQKPDLGLQPLSQGFIQYSNEPQSHIALSQPRQGKISKALDIVRNPMTALQYKAQGQDIPDNFTRGDKNSYDNALDTSKGKGGMIKKTNWLKNYKYE